MVDILQPLHKRIDILNLKFLLIPFKTYEQMHQ